MTKPHRHCKYSVVIRSLSLRAQRGNLTKQYANERQAAPKSKTLGGGYIIYNFINKLGEIYKNS